MNPQTETNINQALDWLQKTGGAIQDFTVEQAPIYCREVITLQIATGIGGILVALILAFATKFLWDYSGAVNDRAKKEAKTEIDFYDARGAGAGVRCLSFFCGVASLCFSICSSVSVLEALIAPRVVILNHIRGLR